MRKIIFIIGLFISLSAVSCVKQKKCDCDLTGTWQYLEEPYYIPANKGLPRKKIVAVIKNSEEESNDFGVKITGKIPKEFRCLYPIRVRYCIERVKDNFNVGTRYPCVNELKCIEKED